MHPHLSVFEFDLSSLEVRDSRVSMLHEVFIVSLGEVVSGMGTSRFFPGNSRVNSLLSLNWINLRVRSKFSSSKVSIRSVFQTSPLSLILTSLYDS
jgi:hypothetical protein